jgi:tetratricopeptide (TPR) repeat protein
MTKLFIFLIKFNQNNLLGFTVQLSNLMRTKSKSNRMQETNYTNQSYVTSFIAFDSILIDTYKIRESHCNGKGLCLQYLNRTNEAIEFFNESIRLDPTQPNYYLSKGFSLKALNKNA